MGREIDPSDACDTGVDIARSRGLISRSAAEMVINDCDAAIPQHRGRRPRECNLGDVVYFFNLSKEVYELNKAP